MHQKEKSKNVLLWLIILLCTKIESPYAKVHVPFLLNVLLEKKALYAYFLPSKKPNLTFIRIDFTFNGGDCTTSWVKKVFKGPWVPSVQESWDKFQTVGGPWNLERIKSRSHSVAIKLCRRKLRLVHMVQKSCLDVHTECRGTN